MPLAFGLNDKTPVAEVKNRRIAILADCGSLTLPKSFVDDFGD